MKRLKMLLFSCLTMVCMFLCMGANASEVPLYDSFQSASVGDAPLDAQTVDTKAITVAEVLEFTASDPGLRQVSIIGASAAEPTLNSLAIASALERYDKVTV